MNNGLRQRIEAAVATLDPRTKLVSFLTAISLLLAFNHPAFTGLLFVFTLLVGLSVQPPIRFWRLRYLVAFPMVMSGVLWTLYLGESGISWLFAIAMALRLGGIIIAGTTLVGIMSPDELQANLRLLHIPMAIAFTVGLAFRLIPTYAGAVATIKEAQIVRGLDLQRGPMHQRLPKYMSLAVPFLIYAIRQTDAMSIALESRGFSLQHPRSTYTEYHMRFRDYAILVSIGIILLVCVVLRLRGFGVLVGDRL